jgi:hypothetical protein
MFLIHGFVFSYEAVRDWKAKLTPVLAEELRRSRKRNVGGSWYTDETYVRVHCDWKYHYRAIDRDGALVDVMLSEHRNLAAARRFFRSAKAVTGAIPDQVTTDGHDAYPGRSGRSWAAVCGIGQTAIATIASSRIIVASRADVDRCSASRASRQHHGFATVTTNSGTSCALDLVCANMFPPLHGAFSTCVGQPSHSVSWRLLDQKALRPRNCSSSRLES